MLLYNGFSVFDVFWTLFLRGACVLGLIYTLPHFEENPVLIAVVVFFLLLGSCFIGNEVILIYKDRVVQKSNSLASLFFKRKPKTIEISQIQRAYLQQASKNSPHETGIAILLAFFLSRNTSSMLAAISFQLKNGATIELYTHLDNGKREEMVALVNSLLS